MNRKYIFLLLFVSFCATLMGCDRRYTRKTIKDYDIENSEIDQRRKANAKKSFQNLATVPPREFDHPTLKDFEDLKDTLGEGQSHAENEKRRIELQRSYQENLVEKQGPFALELVDKVNEHTILAESLEFKERQFELSDDHVAFLNRFVDALSDDPTDIFLIAPKNEKIIVNHENRDRMQIMLNYLQDKKIASNRLYFGFDDQVRKSYFPSLDRITEDEIKIFIFP